MKVGIYRWGGWWEKKGGSGLVIVSDPLPADPLRSEAGFPAGNREALSKEEGGSVETGILRIEGVSASACGVGIGILKDES